MDLFEDLFSTMSFANDTERKKIKILFENYMDNIPDNFYKNQFELAKEYPGSTYNEWVKILKHPAFDTWKSEQIAIIATTQTDKALAGGDVLDKEALNLLKVRQDVLKEEKKVEKPTIIVIPNDLFFREEK